MVSPSEGHQSPLLVSVVSPSEGHQSPWSLLQKVISLHGLSFRRSSVSTLSLRGLSFRKSSVSMVSPSSHQSPLSVSVVSSSSQSYWHLLQGTVLSGSTTKDKLSCLRWIWFNTSSWAVLVIWSVLVSLRQLTALVHCKVSFKG